MSRRAFATSVLIGVLLATVLGWLALVAIVPALALDMRAARRARRRRNARTYAAVLAKAGLT